MPVCPPVTVDRFRCLINVEYPSGSSIPIKNHFCRRYLLHPSTSFLLHLSITSLMAKLWVLSRLFFAERLANDPLRSMKWRTSFSTWPISLITLQIAGTLHTTCPRNWPYCPSTGCTDSSLEITFVFQNQVHQQPPGKPCGLLSNRWCPSFSSQWARTLFILSSWFHLSPKHTLSGTVRINGFCWKDESSGLPFSSYSLGN